MKSRGVRVLLLVTAAAALVGAGAGVWQIEQRSAAARAAAGAFERDAREAVVSLSDWRAAQRAYVAEGQPPAAWMTKAGALAEAIQPRLAALRAAAASASAQGMIESAIEAFTALLQSDARAREYVKAGQLISASDVIFVESAPAIEKAIIGIDTARGEESVNHAVALEELRGWELVVLGAGAGIALLLMLLLVPVPRSSESAAGDESAGGLHLHPDLGDGIVSRAQATDAAQASAAAPPQSRASGDAAKGDTLGDIDFALDGRGAAKGPNLEAVADLCSSLARVQDTRELPGLLERTAKALDATGVIVWMPDGPQGTLRPVLAHGYASLALSRMGIIHPAADNATATAYRTKSVVVVPAEALASGAVVAPLVSSEGCSGAMAVELREGVEPTPQVRAVATIVAAQLATMFTPGSMPAAPRAEAAPAGAGGGQSAAAGRP
jgi:hypothetical protein